MSPQHDYVIDNSTGANVRSDINSVLQAISSNNSGSSAPSTTYALQSFANTTDSMLQLRNAANNAFVNLRKFDGTLPLPDGTNSAPSLFFDDDTDTGIFSSAADTFDISTGSTARISISNTGMVINDNSDDFDIRIEGNSFDNLVRIDAGNDRIGIGTSTPSTLLHISDSESSGGVGFTLHNSSGSSGTTPYCFIGAILNPSRNGGEIRFGREGTYGDQNSADSFMAFYTAENDTNNERLRISASGAVGIGTSSIPSGFKLAVNGDLSLGETSGSDNTFIDQKQNGSLEIINSGVSSNDAGQIRINRVNNISGDTSNFRDVNIYDGKGSTVLYVDGSEKRVGFFTDAPEAAFHIEDPLTTGAVIQLTNAGGTSLPNGTDCGRIDFETRDSSGVGVCSRIRSTMQDTSDAGHKLRFQTGTASTITDRLMIFDSGTVIIGSTTDQGSRMIEVTAPVNHHAAMFKNDQDVFATVEIVNQSNNTGAQYVTFRRAVGSNTNGTISKTSGAGVNYNTSSDYRLKENVVSLTGAITRLKTLLPKRFNWIEDESKTVVDGFLAHEVTAVPEAVTGTKDEVNTKGEPEYQQMDHSKLVPLLVAAVQELTAKVEALEAA